MDDAPLPEGTAPHLKFLKALVTILTGTMIVGLVVVIWLLVIRLPAAMESGVRLPERIALPEGAEALAFTQGNGWYAVVTSANQILIYDAASGALRQTVQIAP